MYLFIYKSVTDCCMCLVFVLGRSSVMGTCVCGEFLEEFVSNY